MIAPQALSISGIRLSPDHAALWTVAGLVELKLHNTENARKILLSGLKVSPTHGPLYKALGKLYYSILCPTVNAYHVL